ncbi:MAG: ATP-binding cassette domain-containing protein [Ignavibacterium sp.]|nr:ATP-binding cassette domain-containing protein [Ignavibacterium sp.]MCX7611980.1 ATP-binding cassette domain-containing protein [Ignavibacterium sp.]MDW8375402.1 ATP-binding cassette domain-containing protein [Ignavibacteriales bacterium]
MLEVKNLTKHYGEIKAVENLSFTVYPGKIFGLLGPNGAGKSTTIKSIINVIKPTEGQILFDGKPINYQYLNRIGYLPEERGLYKKSKVIDVICYLASLKNIPKDEIITRANLWLEKLGIADLKNRRVEELSKGNQQKIQFICSVIHNPDLLILDEPFSGFDPINQQEIKNFILDFLDEGKSIILSTHQMDTAEKLCSEILLLNKGKSVLQGSLQEIKKNFGGNHIRVSLIGDTNFLDSLDEVISYEVYSNFIEIHLANNISPSNFLKKLVEKTSIEHFLIIEPTLHKIFIDTIKNEKSK